MMITRAFPATAALLALLLSGACNSGSNTPATTTAGGPTITVKDFAFSPANLEVKAGSTVTVNNGDGVPHTVTSEAKAGDYKPGGVAGVQFDTATIGASGSATFVVPASATTGTEVPYYCAIHTSGMKNTGKITVK